ALPAPPPHAAAAPSCAVLDAAATRLRRSPLRPTTSASGEELTVDAIVDYSQQFLQGAALRPEYDRGSLKWLLEMADQKVSSGELRKVLVRNADAEIIGWYLYYLRAGGNSEVLHVAGRPDHLGAVLAHLFYGACGDGAPARSGGLAPRLCDEHGPRHAP